MFPTCRREMFDFEVSNPSGREVVDFYVSGRPSGREMFDFDVSKPSGREIVDFYVSGRPSGREMFDFGLGSAVPQSRGTAAPQARQMV